MIGELVKLRALEPEDLEFLFQLENDNSLWEVSHTQAPFSKFLLKQYLENAHLDIYEAKQLRLIIEEKATGNTIGMIDLFDFNPQHKRAGVGIALDSNYRKNGFASEALSLLIEHAFSILHLHQLYASMTKDNSSSIQLFEKLNFQKAGIKKDWISTKDGFKDELFYQLLNE